MPASPDASDRFRADEILVGFDEGVDSPAAMRALAAVGGRLNGVLESLDDLPSAARVQLGGGMSVEKAIAIISNLPGVNYAEPDYLLSTQAVSNDTAYASAQTWGLYGDLTTPINTYGSQAGEAWAAGATGSMKVAVAVVDTGVDYTHPDLYLNVWLNPREIPTSFRAALRDTDADGVITFRDLNNSQNAAYVTDRNANGRIDAGDLLNDARWENGLDEDANGYRDDLVGWDFRNNDNDPMDDAGHGTHVAGTIGAIGGNGVGVAGVAWATQLVALKFMDAGGGYTSDAARALDYFSAAAAASTTVEFVATNNSYGSSASASQTLLDAIGRGAAKDILFVAAAGNGGADLVGDNNDATANYPSNYSTVASAGYEAVVAVAALDKNGLLAGLSNYGRTSVDLAAPGASIYSTKLGGAYGSMTGTSMATPHVTGAIALYASVHPGATAAATRTQLLASTIDTASVATKVASGGRLDVASFVGTVAPPPPPPPPPPSSAIVGTSGSDLLTATGTGADTLQGLAGADTLDGGAGADRLEGGAGDDVFIVDQAGDIVVETAAAGADLVKSSVTYTLPGEVESLTLTGTGAISGTGNTLSNKLTGNSGANTLSGEAGNDSLDGGAGADRLVGGIGSDTYYVDNTGDVVVEAPGAGTDRIYSTISRTLEAEVERLYLTGANASNGTGNALANVLSGNGASNQLLGLAGDDIINGGGGADTLAGGAGADILTGGSGADRFQFAKGTAQGDVITDFAAGDILQLTGYSAGSTLTQVSGSTTDWGIRDAATGAVEIISLTNAYSLTSGEYLFG